MELSTLLPWIVLLAYCGVLITVVPRNVSAKQFFGGTSEKGAAPGLWLLVASAAISWIFAKSINNAAGLAATFGVTGGIGYSIYYLSFIVAAVGIWFIRKRGGYSSLSNFLTSKYGSRAAKLFLVTIAIRLFNEVWSNTKVTALYFGSEGSEGYWIAVLAVTIFTVYYSLRGGLRGSILTDSAQMILAAILLIVILIVLGPGLAEQGIPSVDSETTLGGLTFCALAFVQVFSYPFHDPVLTDRAFITEPRTMVKGLVMAGILSGSFILLFSTVGLYSRAFGLEGDPSVIVPATIGLPMLLIFNAIMLTSAGSTLDSTFASSAKLGARDWPDKQDAPDESDTKQGRRLITWIALLGNIPLLAIYIGDAGPAIIAATTISGTMVMGLAPIFLLSFIRRAGKISFHLAFWPGLLFGLLIVVEGLTNSPLLPDWIDIGGGEYADDLGVNLYGLALCTAGYLIGTIFSKEKTFTEQSTV
ncbi:MAG: Na+/proline symporter [Ignavibacteriae bacterium]|nr:Na+/proline symporter [Ignavibacteriota bacterium]MCB9215141.1 Na+/proline symporter [Ignavibacteria bacterium]